MTTDAVCGLYIARWGKPSRNAIFQVDGFEVEIFKWSADVSPQGVNLCPRALLRTRGSSAGSWLHRAGGRPFVAGN